VYHQPGRFRKHGHTLGLLLARKNGEHEYFGSFGLLPPNEWELELKKLGKKSFFRNDNQLRWVGSQKDPGIIVCFF